jgi:hypothetical protein
MLKGQYRVAPSRVLLLAEAGAFEQAHVTMTRGIHVGDRPDAAERIAAQWNAIADRSAEQVPVSGAAQYHHEVHHPSRPAQRAPEELRVPVAGPL